MSTINHTLELNCSIQLVLVVLVVLGVLGVLVVLFSWIWLFCKRFDVEVLDGHEGHCIVAVLGFEPGVQTVNLTKNLQIIFHFKIKFML